MIALRCVACSRPRVTRKGRRLCDDCLAARKAELVRQAEADEATARLLSRPGSAVIKGDAP